MNQEHPVPEKKGSAQKLMETCQRIMNKTPTGQIWNNERIKMKDKNGI